MAQVFPEDFELAEGEKLHKGEFLTLSSLKEGLSDQYMIFHGVHWTRVQDDSAVYGEIDFLILNQYGRVLAIEQKETQIEVNAKGELVPIYKEMRGLGKSSRTINSQVSRNIGSLRAEYQKRYPEQRLEIDHLLYVPNAMVSKNLPSNIALGRIVDSTNRDQLISIINEMFDKNPMPTGDHTAKTLDIQTFFLDKAEVSPQIGLIGQSARQRTTRLSSGLAEWVERLEFSPYRLWVQGTAGSGKTQLALRELRKADTQNKTAMYICFNRALVDSVKISAPNPKNCWTFHELAKFVAESQGQVIDFGDEATFKQMVDYFLTHYDDLKEQLDVLVIDEGQDFFPEWGAVLLELVKPDGRMVWLEDTSQRIYGRPSSEPDGWVKLSSPTNYRSPQHVLTLINGLNLTDEYLESGNGYAGLTPGHFVYQDGDVIGETSDAVQDLIEQGFAPESIAVLSFHGAKNSVFLSDKVYAINGFSIKKSTGYDKDSNAIWSNGELLVDTLYRFKGQCADAIVLTEIDFAEWDQVIKNKLFVGLTRARLTVNLVMSKATEKLFIEKGFL
jgi:hypothetical protein